MASQEKNSCRSSTCGCVYKGGQTSCLMDLIEFQCEAVVCDSTRKHIHVYLHTYIFMYVYMCTGRGHVANCPTWCVGYI